MGILSFPGLGDDRAEQVLEALQNEAGSLVGEMMLGQLVESAEELLTERNAPEGDCALCMEPFQTASSSASAEPPGSGKNEALAKLPCYHCFHL